MRVAPRWAAYQLRLGNPPGSSASGGGENPTVTFPTTPLRFRVQIALGADLTASWLTWPWTDITRFVRYADGIATRTGRPDEASVVGPGQTTLTLDNRDGRCSRRNPTGPYYGLLSRNTPLWVQLDAGAGFVTRVQHYVNEWPTRWDRSGNDCTVRVVAAGVLRRLGQGEVAQSALRRAVLASAPAGYWPMEDGTAATVAGSALPGVAGLSVAGTVNFASTDGPPGSGPLCDGLLADDGTLRAPAVIPDGASAFQISFVFRAGLSTGSAGAVVTWIDPTGTTERFWTILVDSIEGNQVSVFADDDGTGGAGATIAASALGSVTFGQYYHCVYRQRADGTRSVILNGVEYAAVVNNTSGPPRNVAVTPYRPDLILPQGEISFGHLAMWADSTTDLAAHYQAMLGYVGEMAHQRIERVCAEAGIAYASTGAAATSQRLGAQPVGSPLRVIRDAEATDLGVVFEAGFGLGYQAKSARYNAPVLLALDFAQRHIAEAPEPADDDRYTRNRFTVFRLDGAEATVQDSAGIAADGLYDDSATVNTATDTQLGNIAGWRVRQPDEDRWPAVALNLYLPALVESWTSLPFGARMTATNPPDEVAPDGIDAFVEGYGERFNPREWRAVLNTTPATVYEVYQVEGSGNRGRVDAAASTLAADVSDVATSLSVASPGVVWAPGTADFDIFVAGERMTVTDIAGGSSPQTFTVTRSVNTVVKAHTAGAPVRLWRPGVVAL